MTGTDSVTEMETELEVASDEEATVEDGAEVGEAPSAPSAAEVVVVATSVVDGAASSARTPAPESNIVTKAALRKLVNCMLVVYL